MTKFILSLMVLLSLTACGGPTVRRTLETDPALRVLLDPRIPVEQYVQIRRALVQSGKFEVVDRRDGFELAIQEQDMQFRSGYADRFSDQEKWAHIGQMYGARGIITAHAECYQDKNFWGSYRRYCKQELAFIDGVTGVVEFAVNGKNDEPWVVGYTAPDWDDTVAKAVETFPEYFKPRIIKAPLDQYMAQSEERSKRERARNQPHPASYTPATYNMDDQRSDLNLMKQAQQNYLNEQKGE
jgi:hypothetical protein